MLVSLAILNCVRCRSVARRGARLMAIALFTTVTWAEKAGSQDGSGVTECRWADGPITIDGKADEAAWKNAQVIDDFTMPWLGQGHHPAPTKTRARLLWDREYLYFFAQM